MDEDIYKPYHPDTRAEVSKASASISQMLNTDNKDTMSAVASINEMVANHLTPEEKDIIARENYWKDQNLFEKIVWMIKYKKTSPCKN